MEIIKINQLQKAKSSGKFLSPKMPTKINLGSARTNQSDSALNILTKEKTEAQKSIVGAVNSKTRLKPFSFTVKSSIEMSNNLKAKHLNNKISHGRLKISTEFRYCSTH